METAIGRLQVFPSTYLIIARVFSTNISNDFRRLANRLNAGVIIFFVEMQKGGKRLIRSSGGRLKRSRKQNQWKLIEACIVGDSWVWTAVLNIAALSASINNDRNFYY